MANFAIVTKPATMPALDSFRVGPYEYPDKATTIVIQVDDILPAAVNKYRNILFDNIVQLDLKGVPNTFWNQWRQLSGLYPLGIDIFFTCDDVLIDLPKSNGSDRIHTRPAILARRLDQGKCRRIRPARHSGKHTAG